MNLIRNEMEFRSYGKNDEAKMPVPEVHYRVKQF